MKQIPDITNEDLTTIIYTQFIAANVMNEPNNDILFVIWKLIDVDSSLPTRKQTP